MKMFVLKPISFLVLLLSVALASSQRPSESFLAFFCSRNPSALPALCGKYLQSCPTINWGEWQFHGYSPGSATNASCPSASRLLRYTRSKNTTKLSSSCKKTAEPLYETEDRCPPSTQAKVTALMQALGNDFSSEAPSVTSQKVTYQKPAAPRPSGGWGWGRRRRSYSALPPPPPSTCKFADPRDLAIVIDSSGSVGNTAFNKAVDTLADFLGYMCHKFDCDGPETRLAVVTYGSQAKEVFNFAYSGSTHKSKTQIINDVKTRTTYMDRYSGATATGTALEYCRDNIFQTSKGMRSNSKRQILVLTDGRSNRGTKPGVVATELHKDLGADIYALGIGHNVNIKELQSITKDKVQNKYNLLYLALFNDFSEFFKVSKVVKADLDYSGKKCKAASKIYDKKK